MILWSVFFFSSRRRHTRSYGDWSSDVCSSDLDNRDKNPSLTVEQNAAMIEPGLEQATDAFKKTVYAEVKQTLDTIYATHGKGQWKQKLMINDRIADSVFQQVLMRADEYSVLATSNLNGD